MLASITPLGERGRRSRWGVTVTAFVLASTLAGAAVGALAGWLGRLLLGAAGPGERWRLGVLAALIAGGLLLDLRPGRLRLPTVRRQVNEDWLYTYRGWVYGAGFGAQLGSGVVTIVTSATVYLVPAAAFVSSAPALGLLAGACFGALRGASVLPGVSARDTPALVRLHDRLAAWDPASRRLTLLAQAAMLVLAIVLAVAA
jgi:hypothetical protein